MRCPRCQHENPTGSNFCLGCGARFGSSCSSCGHELPPRPRFCNKCGTPLALASPGQSRFSSPESYTSLHLAQKILTSKRAFEGERWHYGALWRPGRPRRPRCASLLRGAPDAGVGRGPTRTCHSAHRILAHLLDKSSTRVDRGTAFETALCLILKSLPGTGGCDMRISSICFSSLVPAASPPPVDRPAAPC